MKPEDFPKDPEKGRKRYVLGEFELEPDTLRLSRRGEIVHLTRKPFQVLVYLVEHHDRPVTRAELLEAFWGRDDVYDETLTKSVGAIRKALGDQQEQPCYILTHWAEGYRYIGPLAEARSQRAAVPAPVAVPPPANRPPQPVRRRRMAVASVLLLSAVLIPASFVALRMRSVHAVPPAAIASLAVLPLRTFSANPDDEYLSEGLTERLVTSLSTLRGLRVLSRGSVARYRGHDADPQEVGARLGVAAVIEGSVRHEADQLRVAIRLVDALDGRVLWATELAGRNPRDILDAQDALARGAAEALRGPASGAVASAGRRAGHPEARLQYLRGRYFLDKRTVPFANKALASFQQAVQLDPDDALSHAGLADVYLILGALGGLSPPEAWRLAGPAATRAVALDDQLSEAHRVLAQVLIIRDFDWEGAEREYRRAIDLDPKSVTARQTHAFFLQARGRNDDAVAEMQLALELDPLSVVVTRDLGLIYYGRHEYDRAIAQLRKGIDLDPTYLTLYRWLIYVYERQGNRDQAVESDLKRQQVLGASESEVARMRRVYVTQGWREYWRARMVTEQASVPSVTPLLMASLYEWMGDFDQTFAWLERAYRDHSFGITEINGYPMFEEVSHDPRYASLLARLHLQAPDGHMAPR